MSRRFRFTGETNILEALELDERVVEAFKRMGLHCTECVAAEVEDIRMIALYHEKDLDEILETLNALGIRKPEKPDGKS